MLYTPISIINVMLETEEILAEILKNVILGKIENEFQIASREWINKWLRGEVSSMDVIMLPDMDDVRRYKEIAIRLVQSLNEDELLDGIMRARPDLHKLWTSPQARERVGSEITNINNYISHL
jgi:hypothetical protein